MHNKPWQLAALTTAGILTMIVVGLLLRVGDPTSTEQLPAEDPYTHLALTREHLRDGSIDPLNYGGRLYPPGLHAFLADTSVFTGASVYDVVRYGPLLFSVIGIAGVGLLLWRHLGPVAAVTGSLVYAIAPEFVFRTTMMAPTALDLALVPYFLLVMIEIVQGRLQWIPAAAALALFFTFAHPWLLTVLALASLAFFLLLFLSGWKTENPHTAPTTLGLATAMAILGVATGLSISGCGGACGPGLQDLVPNGERYNVFGPAVAGLALVLVAGLAFAAPRMDPLLARIHAREPALWSRLTLSTLLLVYALGLGVLAVRTGLPAYVDLRAMFGWAIVGIALLGLAAAPLIRDPAAHAGAALALVTLPFVLFNPLQSEYLPHRTAAYLGIGLAILVGAGAAALVRGAGAAMAAELSRSAPGAPRTNVVLVPALLVLLAVGGGVAAATPPPNPWYRLYGECEHDALRGIAQQYSSDLSMILVTGSWQSKLLVAAYTDDASRVWYKQDLFTDPNAPRLFLDEIDRYGRNATVVLDPHLYTLHPNADTRFLESEPWRPVATACAQEGNQTSGIRTYTNAGGAA